MLLHLSIICDSIFEASLMEIRSAMFPSEKVSFQSLQKRAIFVKCSCNG